MQPSLLCSLQNHPRIKRIWHPFSETNPTHEMAFHLLDDYTPLLYLELDATSEQTKEVIDSFELATQGVHLGTCHTMVTLCEETTHGVLTPEERTLAGIVPNGIRISVGMEDPGAIVLDVINALNSI